MDSLTQIILGASVGEVVLGKRIGNRAMVLGAIGGTIPDLDVVSNFFMSEINSLAFHRGISHSIFFAIFFSFLISFLVSRWYTRYDQSHRLAHLNVGYWNYYKLFFWSIITHPFLDCFTTYGTQLFAPFSDYRVAFNNISVADPLYTGPFLICLVIAACYSRTHQKRRFFNYLGIGLSSAYMIFTLWNLSTVTKAFKEKLSTQGIEYNRLRVSPTILNNVLWYGVAESDSAFYINYHTIWDSEAYKGITEVPKNHEILQNITEDHTLETLKWFSDDYYAMLDLGNGMIQFNDMRFGTFTQKYDNSRDYIFHFILKLNKTGRFEMIKSNAGPPDDFDGKQMIGQLWNSMKGIESIE